MNDGRRIRYVLDTDTTSALQRGQPEVKIRLEGLDPQTAASTVVTLFEQLRGRLAEVNRARDEARLRIALQRLLDTLRYFCTNNVLPFDVAASSIYRSLVAQRLRVGTQDLRIAAIVLANDAILVTSNRRDFERVPGLRIEDWNVV
jgi:tRNA(fMet)-specific endonuclease VapC